MRNARFSPKGGLYLIGDFTGVKPKMRIIPMIGGWGRGPYGWISILLINKFEIIVFEKKEAPLPLRVVAPINPIISLKLLMRNN